MHFHSHSVGSSHMLHSALGYTIKYSDDVGLTQRSILPAAELGYWGYYHQVDLWMDATLEMLAGLHIQ